MKTPTSLSLLSFASMILIGCASHAANMLVGDWDTTVPDVGPATISYAPDGTMTMTGDFAPAGKSAKMVISGKWSADGDKVHMTYSSVKFTGLPPALQAKEKTMEDGAEKGMGTGTDNVMVVKFDGDDSFSSTDNKGVTSTFKRKGK